MTRFATTLLLVLGGISMFASTPAFAQQPQVQELIPPYGAGSQVGSSRRQSLPVQGGPQFGGQPGGAAAAITTDDGLIIGPNLIVAMGPQPDRIWAFSREHGSWNRQTVPRDQLTGPIVPQISGNLVVFQSGKKLFAFSATRGNWHSCDLEAPVPVGINLTDEQAWCRLGSRVYAFSAKNGGWTSIDVVRD